MAFGSGSSRVLAAIGLIAAGLGLASAASPAQARGFVSFGVGVPLFPGPSYYYPPPPVVAYPPPAPIYYAPAPVYALPPGAAYAPPAAPQGECREYQSTTTIAGQPESVVGTACRQPDGTWRIVN